jgi:hypothetical protein
MAKSKLKISSVVQSSIEKSMEKAKESPSSYPMQSIVSGRDSFEGPSVEIIQEDEESKEQSPPKPKKEVKEELKPTILLTEDPF